MSEYINDLFSLSGKTALVVGGAGAIGSAVSEALARAGATIIVHDLSQERLDFLKNKFVDMGIVFNSLQADIVDPKDAFHLISCAKELTGRIDILVNLQAINPRKLIAEATQEEFDLAIAVNLRSVYFLSQAIYPIMKSQGGGKILHFSSLAANFSFDTTSIYAASKAALTSLTRSQAHEWAADNIQVNAIEPGFVQTQFTHQLWNNDYGWKWFSDFIPLGRLATPEDLITSVIYLTAPATNYITGQHIIVDGGVLSGSSWIKDPFESGEKKE